MTKATPRETAIGLLFFAALGVGGYLYMQARANARVMAPDLTLAGYADLSQEQRGMRIAAAAAGAGAGDRIGDFTRCMGDFAKTKAPELPFDEVFAWCETERKNAPERFAGHFNELDAKDLSMDAVAVCQTMVQNGLKVPASAKFAYVKPIPRGQQRYLISSLVDAQNSYGAMLRAHYVCEIQHDGVGDPLTLASWKVHQLVVE